MGECEEALGFDFGVEESDGVDAGYVLDVDVVFLYKVIGIDHRNWERENFFCLTRWYKVHEPSSALQKAKDVFSRRGVKVRMKKSSDLMSSTHQLVEIVSIIFKW